MKSIVEFLQSSHNSIKDWEAFDKHNFYNNDTLTFEEWINSNPNAKDWKKIIGEYLKGKYYIKGFTIKFKDVYLHIFRYEDMHMIRLNFKLSKNSAWPRTGNDSFEYSMSWMSTASQQNLVEECIKAIIKNYDNITKTLD